MGYAKNGGMPKLKKKVAKKKVSAPVSTQKPAPGIPPSKPKPIAQIIEHEEHDKEKQKPLKELSEKQLYFAKRYALNENACKAARESGYSEWYGTVFLANDALILKEVNRIRKERSKKFEVNADRVIAELTKVAFGNLDDFLTLAEDGTPVINCHDLGRDEMAALSEVTQDMYTESAGTDEDGNRIVDRVKKTKIKMHSKVQALDQLARIFKLFGDGEGLDKDTPELKAVKIRAALKAMKEIDG